MGFVLRTGEPPARVPHAKTVHRTVLAPLLRFFVVRAIPHRLGYADCEVRFFVRLHRKTADLLTQVKGFMCKLTE